MDRKRQLKFLKILPWPRRAQPGTQENDHNLAMAKRRQLGTHLRMTKKIG